MKKNKTEFYFKSYFLAIKDSINLVDFTKLERIADLIIKASKSGNKVIVVGNGGSASIASHLTVDLINSAKIKSLNFSDASIITCFSNDYGYDSWISKALDCYAIGGDVVILISSSGESNNIINAAAKAKSIGANVVTLTGFSSSNSLNGLGDINLWVDSNIYNIVEMTHSVWLLSVVDYIIEEKKVFLS